jgi:hypothetical protein
MRGCGAQLATAVLLTIGVLGLVAIAAAEELLLLAVDTATRISGHLLG